MKLCIAIVACVSMFSVELDASDLPKARIKLYDNSLSLTVESFPNIPAFYLVGPCDSGHVHRPQTYWLRAIEKKSGQFVTLKLPIGFAKRKKCAETPPKGVLLPKINAIMYNGPGPTWDFAEEPVEPDTVNGRTVEIEKWFTAEKGTEYLLWIELKIKKDAEIVCSNIVTYTFNHSEVREDSGPQNKEISDHAKDD